MILASYCLKLAATTCDEKFLICRFVKKIYLCKAQIKNKKRLVASARAQLRF